MCPWEHVSSGSSYSWPHPLTTRIFTKWTHSCNHSQEQEIEYPPASQRNPWVPIMKLPPRVKNILPSNNRDWFYYFRIYIKSIMPYVFLCIWLLAPNLHSPLLILFHCLLPLVKRKHIIKNLEFLNKFSLSWTVTSLEYSCFLDFC